MFFPMAAMAIATAPICPLPTAGYALTSCMPTFLSSRLEKDEMHSAVATILATVVLAVPTAQYPAMSAATLPALFPTTVRCAAMGPALNVSASLLGGTMPLIARAPLARTGIQPMPANRSRESKHTRPSPPRRGDRLGGGA